MLDVFFSHATPETCEVEDEGNNSNSPLDAQQQQQQTTTTSCHIIDGRLSLYHSNIHITEESSRRTTTMTHERILHKRKQQRRIDWIISHYKNNNDNKNVHTSHSRRQLQTSEPPSILHSIQQIMDNGELDNCHPAIISVKFRNITRNSLENSIDDDIVPNNDDIQPYVTIEGTMTSWIAIGSSALLFIILLFTRYKFYRHAKYEKQQNNNNTHEDTGSATSEDAFFELDVSRNNSNHYYDGKHQDDYMDQFDMVSSLTMSKSRNAVSEGSKIGSSLSPLSLSSSPASPMVHKSIIRSSPFSSIASRIKARRQQKQRKCNKPDPPSVDKAGGRSSGEDSSSKSYLDSVQSEVRQETYEAL